MPGLVSASGILQDPNAPVVKSEPSKWDLEVMGADRVSPGEVELTLRQFPSRPTLFHTVHVTDDYTAPMPKHIREALDELL